MSELLALQFKFARMVPALIAQAHALGFNVTLGDAYRDPRLHGEVGIKGGYGHPRSCHKVRLAIDLNLFRDGQLLQSSEAHQALGQWWEAQDPAAKWGGKFQDGNHYSLEFQGMR